MKFEDALHELQTEPVAESAMHKAIAAVRGPRQIRGPIILKRGLPFAIGIAAVAGYSLIPWRKGDQLWARATANLLDAKVVHLKIDQKVNSLPSEAWICGSKVREASKDYEYRNNGKLVTLRRGAVSIYLPVKRDELYFVAGSFSYQVALSYIQTGKAKPVPKVVNGKEYITYRIRNGGSSVSDAKQEGLPRGMYTVESYLTAFVDRDLGKIVRIEQEAVRPKEFLQIAEKRHWTLDNSELERFRLTAEVDYPVTIEDSTFDPPTDALSKEQTKAAVAAALKNKVAEATVQGQKITLRGVFYDGHIANVIWTGCGGDFASDDRFEIEGFKTTNRWDVRALSSAKQSKAGTAKNPLSQQGSQVVGLLPKTINLTMPVFAPDKTRPYPGRKGFHSKKVGTVTFKNVPVTPILWLQNYERELGLQGTWW